jgi:hypothetical protein
VTTGNECTFVIQSIGTFRVRQNVQQDGVQGLFATGKYNFYTKSWYIFYSCHPRNLIFAVPSSCPALACRGSVEPLRSRSSLLVLVLVLLPPINYLSLLTLSKA